ncbi:transcriptional regulator [Trinickia dabaoshanensis]|uniref:Transcriptional regulator n=1 Tax=Trinickia dabaoshanensis TaxID=564714 RepID=A0A2N7VLF3_9BURK|nr:transcriptional regulator [Trinickia dabaoshanensis]
MPDSAVIDVYCLAALRGRSVASTWRDAAKGLIPAPKKYGSSTRWNVGEVRRALALTV